MNTKLLYIVLLLGLAFQMISCTHPELDKTFYVADEVKGMKLLKQKNCRECIAGGTQYWDNWGICCNSGINPYIYFTTDKKPYNGNISIKYDSKDTKCRLLCNGLIVQGFKVGRWHFKSNYKKFDIVGFFKANIGDSGKIEDTYCYGVWRIKNYRDSVFYTINFDDVVGMVKLRKVRFEKGDSILTVQTIYNLSNSINVSPFNEDGCNLNYDFELDFANDTRTHCVKFFSTNYIEFFSRDCDFKAYGDKMSYLRYYSDSLHADVSLLFDTLKNQITEVFVYEKINEGKQYTGKQYTRSKKQRNRNDDSFIRYKENGRIEQLYKHQFFQYNLDSLIGVANNYCQ